MFISNNIILQSFATHYKPNLWTPHLTYLRRVTEPCVPFSIRHLALQDCLLAVASTCQSHSTACWGSSTSGTAWTQSPSGTSCCARLARQWTALRCLLHWIVRPFHSNHRRAIQNCLPKTGCLWYAIKSRLEGWYGSCSSFSKREAKLAHYNC